MEQASVGADALAMRLKALADEIARTDPELMAAADAFIARLQAVKAGSAAPAPGEPMPDFLLPDAEGELASLARFAGRPFVAVFLRGHWCPFCQAQAEALAGAHAALAEAGAQLAVFTPERPRFARTLVDSLSGFSLLCDLDNGYAALLGLLAVIDEPLAQRLAAIDIDLPAYHGAKGWAVPIPATFVLDRAGIIIDRAFDPDYRRRPSLSALFDAVARAR